MKFAPIFLLLAVSLSAHASNPRQFTEADYADLTKDDQLRFTISPEASLAFEMLGLTAPSTCDKAILAATANAAFDLASEEGRDLPEDLDISEVIADSPMPGIRAVKLISPSSQGAYTIRYFPSSVPCLATIESSVTTQP